MNFRHLQHYVGVIMIGSALVLSILFSLVAYQFNQAQAEKESERQVNTLLASVKSTASAALFSSNEEVGWDAINSLLGTSIIYSAELAGFADDLSPGMKISKVNALGGVPMREISVELESIFNNNKILGILRVRPNQQWVDQRARETSLPVILGAILIVSLSFFVSTRAIKLKISQPLVEVSQSLKHIHADSKERLSVPSHLKSNEIGRLVEGFNELLDETNAAFEVERLLRQEMQVVQNNLKDAKGEAELAAQVKSDFLATMSHEIRTPLSGVLGMLAFVLKDPSIHEKTREQIEIAQSNAKTLLTIINDILDLSKVESGKLKIEKVDFNFRQEVNAAIALFRDLSEDKGLSLDLNIQAGVPNVVKSDPTRIRQVLVNLISNAIKFTSKGGISVDIRAKASSPKSFRLLFEVKDSGIGISKENIGKLFHKFEQADISTTRKFGGTGLGLSICKQLVEIMGGEIGVTSIESQGSRFYFELPMEFGDPAKVETEEQALNPHTHQLHILCAEDFATNQVIIRALLEEMGHEVEMVSNGREAIEALIGSRFDMILMDGRMPEMDGLDATRFIRSGLWQGQAIEQSDIKIIALTANVTSEDKERCTESGMDGFLSKPIDEAALHQVVEQTISELMDGHTNLNPLIRASSNELDSMFAMPAVSAFTQSHKKVSSVSKARAGSDISSKLRSTFVSSLPERLEEIDRAMHEEHCDELGRLFHGIKGSAGYLKDDALMAVASSLEKFADSRNMTRVHQEFEQFLQLLKPYQESDLS